MDIKIFDDNSNIALIDIEEALQSVFDPEIHFSVYDIGLIYEIHLSLNHVKIVMTLTSVNCPEAISLPDMVKKAIIEKLNNDKIEIEVTITFEPQWSTENMSDEVLLRLGLL